MLKIKTNRPVINGGARPQVSSNFDSKVSSQLQAFKTWYNSKGYLPVLPVNNDLNHEVKKAIRQHGKEYGVEHPETVIKKTSGGGLFASLFNKAKQAAGLPADTTNTTAEQMGDNISNIKAPQIPVATKEEDGIPATPVAEASLGGEPLSKEDSNTGMYILGAAGILALVYFISNRNKTK